MSEEQIKIKISQLESQKSQLTMSIGKGYSKFMLSQDSELLKKINSMVEDLQEVELKIQNLESQLNS